jgi:hypothetical protein
MVIAIVTVDLPMLLAVQLTVVTLLTKVTIATTIAITTKVMTRNVVL